MKRNIEERVLEVANYILHKRSTVRETAKVFGYNKSTVHKDLVDRLLYLNSQLAKEVKVILEINKAERHIRGGQATKKKFMNKQYEKLHS